MRKLLRAGALCLALCLNSVQGAEPQNAMPPALLEAIAGNEPYASLVEYGLPLISTTEEVEALPIELREQRATAIKKVLLEQMVRAKEEQHRVTSENYAACAQRAFELKAPAAFALYMQLEAEGQLAPRARYAVREALRCMYEAYRVDSLGLRYFVEGSHLATDELREAADWLPLAGLFNLTKMSELTPQKMEADYAALIQLTSELCDVYTGISNREQAEAAVEKLLPLLVRFEATVGTRKLATPEQLAALEKRFSAPFKWLFPALVGQHNRVREANYYDVLRLRVVDYFLF
ncbi:MAG: hypothetical protein IKZ13_05435 [Akkermansia sp.]|nr:hypothetical protein [Akkermansia sp.]